MTFVNPTRCELRYDGCQDNDVHLCLIHDRTTGALGPLSSHVCETCCSEDSYRYADKVLTTTDEEAE